MPIDPLALFDQLDKSQSKIKTLRKAQTETLQIYVKKHLNTARLGIRLPTGTGKSLVALLILESWRRPEKEGDSRNPVAILAASTGLAQDLSAKATEVNIPTVTIFGADGDSVSRQRRIRNLTWYRSGKAIGIFNYHSFLYSSEYKQETVPPKVLVIDDANEFESVRNEFFTVRIERARFKLVYDQILDSLREYYEIYPNLTAFLDRSGSENAVEVIHFIHMKQLVQAVNSNLHLLSVNATFKLSYERNKDKLPSFVAFISRDEIELRPLIVPEDVLKVGQVPKIVFMGATLYERELLQKSFGIRKSKIDLIREEDISEEARKELEGFGRRLILPVDTSNLVKRPGDLPLEFAESLVSIDGKLLLFANSTMAADRAVEYFEKKNIKVVRYEYNDDAERFKSQSNGVLVCANRYIGLDFPGGTAKICCVLQLPMYLEAADIFHFQVLFNRELIQQKIANRLVQAFGRCNRLQDDEAIYFILDPRILARFTGEEQYLAYFPRRIRAEMYAGFYVSEDGSPSAAFEYARSKFFGKKDPLYDEFIDGEKKAWRPVDFQLKDSSYEFEIEAWEKSLLQSYETAASLFELLAEKAKQNNSLLGAWYYYLAALNYHNAYSSYKQPKSREHCSDMLKAAIETGGNSSWFNRLRRTFNQLSDDASNKMAFNEESIEARRLKEMIALTDYENFLNKNNSRKKTWQAVFNDYRNEIISGTHGQMLVVIENMLELMGYKTRRGDQNRGEPDIIAISGQTINKHQFSIEVKSKQEGEIESKENVSQALADASVLSQARGDYRTIPLLITQKEDFSEDALRVASNKVLLIRAMEFDVLMSKLYSRLQRWSTLNTEHQRQSFFDSVVSPYEIVNIFSPRAESVISSEIISKTIPDIS